VNEKEMSDEELEDELDKASRASENKRDVFSILRKEKESLEVKEKRIKDKFKP
jgi:hypothetical protein